VRRRASAPNSAQSRARQLIGAIHNGKTWSTSLSVGIIAASAIGTGSVELMARRINVRRTRAPGDGGSCSGSMTAGLSALT
jgi:hypothetical protein